MPRPIQTSNSLSFQVPLKTTIYYPTIRADWNHSESLRFFLSYGEIPRRINRGITGVGLLQSLDLLLECGPISVVASQFGIGT